MAVQAGSIYVSLQANVRPFASQMGQAVSAVRSATTQVQNSAAVAERHVNNFWGSVGGGGFRPYSLIAVSRAFDNAADRAGLLRGALLAVTGSFGGFTAALTSNLILRYADSFTKLYNQVRAVSGSAEDANARFDALTEVATRSRSSLEATAVLYSRIQKALPEEAPNNILNYVETIQKALALGGATAQEARSAAIQFSQAIASNKLGGDELRAVLETPLGLELAKGLGITIGQLREMSVQGKLTASTVLQGIGAIREEIDKKWKNTILTTDQALTHLDNQLTLYFGNINKTYGATQLLIGGISAIGNNLETIIPILGKVGTVLAAVFAAKFISGASGTIVKPLVDNMAAARAEAEKLGSQIGGLRQRYIEAGLAAQKLKNQVTQAGGDYTQFALPSKQAEVKRAALAVNQSPTNLYKLVQLHLAVADAQANGQERIRASVAAAGAEYRRAGEALQSTLALYDQAVAGTNKLRVAWNGLRAVGSNLVGFLGGPFGVAIAALGLALENYASSQRKQDVAIEAGIKSYEKYTDAANKMQAGQNDLANNKASLAITGVKDQIDSVTKAIENFQPSKGLLTGDIISPAAIREFNAIKSGVVAAGGNLDDLRDRMTNLASANLALGDDIDQIVRMGLALQGLNKDLEETKKAKENLGAAPFLNESDPALIAAAEKRILDLRKALIEYTNESKNSIAVSKLQAQGQDIAAEALKIYQRKFQSAEGQAGFDKAAIMSQITASVRQKKLADEEAASYKRREAAAKAFAETMERLNAENQGAFFGDTDRFVLQQLRQKRATAEEIEQYVQAVKSGNFTAASQNAQDLRQIRLVAQAAEQSRSIIDTYGTLSQLMPKISEEQDVLNIAVQKGAITAGQAAIAFNDFISKFGNFKWISQASDAIGQFASDSILNFKNIGQAAQQLVQRLAQIALQAAFIDPFLKPGVTSVISSFFGIPQFKAGGNPAIGGVGGPGASVLTQHSGGMAGYGNNYRTVSAGIFSNAKKYHKGLYSNEFPAILKDGERVLTENMDKRVSSTIKGLSRMAPQVVAAPAGGNHYEQHLHFEGPPPDDPAVADELFRRGKKSFESMMDERMTRQQAPGGILNRRV